MDTPNAAMTQSASTNRNRDPEKVDKYRSGDDNFTTGDSTTAYGEEKDVTSITVGVVCYRHSTKRELPVRRSVHIFHIEITQLKAEWRKEVAISAKKQDHLEPTIEMLSEFQAV